MMNNETIEIFDYTEDDIAEFTDECKQIMGSYIQKNNNVVIISDLVNIIYELPITEKEKITKTLIMTLLFNNLKNNTAKNEQMNLIHIN